jgi:RNA polymerase sigma-70 factor (ECF subfamily)
MRELKQIYGTTWKVNESRTTDSEWVLRLRPGAVDRDVAIRELRSYLIRAMRRSLTHRYGGHLDVEDVAQQAILKILDSLDTFRQQGSFRTWATSIAVRIGISQLRRHYYRDVSLDATPGSEGLRIDVADLSTHASGDTEERVRVFELLQRLINETLSDRQRLAIQGTLQGLPIEEIAVRLNSNRNAVYKLVHDARVRLREGFESNGVTAEEILATIS